MKSTQIDIKGLEEKVDKLNEKIQKRRTTPRGYSKMPKKNKGKNIAAVFLSVTSGIAILTCLTLFVLNGFGIITTNFLGSNSNNNNQLNYQKLENKPKINNIELNGDLTALELGINAETIDAITTEEKGEANGLATLNETGRLPINQLPVITTDGNGNLIFGASEQILGSSIAANTSYVEADNQKTIKVYDDIQIKNDIENLNETKADKTEITNFLTEEQINTKIADAALNGDNIDTSMFALKSELPDVSNFAAKSELPDITNLANKSEIITSYNKLTDKPEIPDISNLATKDELPNVDNFLTTESDPTVSAWAKAENKPVYDYSELIGTKPAYSYDELTGTKPVYDYSEITNTPAQFSGSYTDLTNTPTLVTSYNDLTDKPTIITSYNNLTDKPEIPSVTGLAAKTYVDDALSEYTTTENLAALLDKKADKTQLYDDTALLNSLNNKVDKIDGKQLSTEDFTTAEKTKLDKLSNYNDAEILEAINNLETGKQNSLTAAELRNIELGGTAMQSYTELDPTVSVWAKAENKPAYDYSELTGTKPEYTAAEVGAHPNTWLPTKTDIGLDSVDNTADLDKPISTAAQTALDAKADKAELYDDSAIVDALNAKVDKIAGKNLSTQDYTTEEKTKLAGLSNYNDAGLRTDISGIQSQITNLTSGSNDAGDIAIMPLDRCAGQYYQLQNGDLSAFGYNEDYAAGYTFDGPQSEYLGKTFNRFKMVVTIPGVVRIGIVNKNVFNANPRYSTCLVKWLVVDFAAYTGYKEWDIEDTVITNPEHYLFVECRSGVTGFFSNRTAAAVTNAAGTTTYPATTSTSGVTAGTSLDSIVNGSVFKSQNILSASARYLYQHQKSSRGGDYARGWQSIVYNQAAKTTYGKSFSAGDLNFGVYKRGNGGDYYLNPVVENAVSPSTNGTNGTPEAKGTAPTLWIPPNQNSITGQEIYAIKFDCVQPGNLTIYHGFGDSVETFNVIRKETHYIRALGLQTLRLRQSITLNEGEWLGVNGYHEGSSATSFIADTCKFAYLGTTTPPFGAGYTMPQGTWPKYGLTLGWTGFTLNPTVENNVLVEKAAALNTYSGGTGYVLNVCLVVRGEPKSKLENMFLSIQGDSISTYRGFITKQNDYPAGNAAGDNAVFYPDSGYGFVNNIDATWWGILAKNCRMRLLRNDAWSGSRVSGTASSTNNTASDARIGFLQQAATAPTTTGRTLPFGVPDIICSMIGTNDLSGNVALGTPNYTTTYTYDTILGAFSRMCLRMKQVYPQTKIVHFLIPRGTAPVYINGNNVSIAELALKFEEIAKGYGQYFCPLSYFDRLNGSSSTVYFTPNTTMCGPFTNISSPATDALHPNAQGMEVIADGLTRFMEASL